MNEELKIIIRAVADEAKKELQGIKKELEKIQKESEQAGKALDDSMKKVGKGVAVAVGAVVALTAAMANLGKASQEYQKAQARLVSGFQSAGSSAEQAKKTYQELFSIMGDVDAATEAAQSLARITTEEKALGQYTKALTGIYATYGQGMPIETIAESIAETAALGKITGDLSRALVEAGISEDAFNASLANLNTQAEREALIRETLIGLYGNAATIYEQNNASIIEYNQSQVRLNEAMAQASKYITPMLTALNNLGAVLLQVLAPAIKTISAIIIVFTQWIITAAKAISSFFGMFSEDGAEATETFDKIGSGINKATNNSNKLGGAFKDATKQAEKLKKQTMGFDELNIVSSNTSASASDSTSGSVPNVNLPKVEIPDMGLDDFNLSLDEVKARMEGVLVLAGLVGAGLAAWGIVNLITNFDTLKGKLATISGTILIVAGALLLVQGYSDAWANGIDWENFGLILGGIALIVGGLTLAFGATAGAIGLIVGSIAMLIVGIKDLVENGYSMEAVLMVALGAILLVVGAVWAFNASLLANPITWIVIAIMALVATFIILWNECEGFRNFWIGLWEKIKEVFWIVVDWLAQACEDVAQFFVDAWEGIKKAWSAVGSFFTGIWNSIKNVFITVGAWFSSIFSGAWNGIKSAFSAVGSFFTGIWNSIKTIFSNVGSAISEAISGTVSKAINTVLSTAVGIINGFISAINLAIDLINAVPGVSISKLNKLEVPQLAKGGIVNSATLAVIGERGKEAVMPLENNTGWMDDLADRIANRSASPSKIVLMLDGKELGWANIHSINSITKQTGRLQLTLA